MNGAVHLQEPSPRQLLGLDEEACRRRNRLSALRYGVNSAPIQLAKLADSAPRTAKGRAPGNKAEALAMINALLPEGAPQLGEDEVLLLPVMQAANSNFVNKYHFFLGTSTLRNVQRGAEEGFALMNSHRTGSVSTPTELPLGRTYAGRYELFTKPSGRTFERVMLWTYMLSGIRPNGSSGPSTDDLARMVWGGTLFDVSLGLNGGQSMCDLCGYSVLDRENCPHVPGTDRSMDKTQVRSQKSRGVDTGAATYTLEDAHSGEVSPVFDGAVPGSGFSKAYAMAQAGELDAATLAQAALSYAALLSEGDLLMPTNRNNGLSGGLIDRARNFLFEGGSTPEGKASGPAQDALFPPDDAQPPPETPRTWPVGDDKAAGDEPVLEPEPGDPEPDPATLSAATDYVPLLEQEKARAKQLQLKLDAFEQAEAVRLAKGVASQFVTEGHLFTAGLPLAEAMVHALSADDATHPQTLEYKDNSGRVVRLSRVEGLKRLFSEVPQADLFSEVKVKDLPEGAAVLEGGDAPDSDIVELQAEARKYAQNNGSTGRPVKGSKNNGKRG